MSTPENTSKRSGYRHLMETSIKAALGAKDPVSDYIVGMEAAGQRELVNSDRLPTDLGSCGRERYEELGFVFGEPDADDPLFMPATLPVGWSREGSDHDMWSYINDERGIHRVAVFYKAAFYDRKAHMSLTQPGREFASRFIYDDEGNVEVPWELLTAEERDDFRASLEGYVKQAEEHPTIYGDRLPKVEERLAALNGASR